MPREKRHGTNQVKPLVYHPGFFFEFIYNIIKAPENGIAADIYVKVLNRQIYLNDTNLIKSQAFNKRTILLYDKLRSDDKFQFDNFFTPIGISIIDQNYRLGAASWTCKLCREDSSCESIGCDHCNEWYHLNCLKMKKIPKNEWFCVDCKTRNWQRKSKRNF